jgi:hypothetical protein
MEFLIALWLPILLSAVAVFLVSSIFHMALPIHKGDTLGIANEEQVGEAMRAGNLQPGEYMMPFCGDMKEMGSEDYKAKLDRGPVLFMTVMPNGPLGMGKSLIQWFLYSLVLGVFVAYVGKLTLGLPEGPAPEFSHVFRVLGTVAVLPYAVSYLQDVIWKGRSVKIATKFAIEGLVYGLVTGAIFAWFWPGG